MIKQRHPLFNKTIQKNSKKQPLNQQIDPTKTRRSYLKYSKNNQLLLNTIIKGLQRNVKQLQNYHQSLQKGTTIRLTKSSSLNQINKFRCSNQIKSIKSKNSLKKNNHRTLKQLSQSNKNKHHHQNNNQVIESNFSKNFGQNGSTMLSIHNADVDQVRKAYQNTYGKQNTNIVDLYNFFRKNIEKSTRFNGGSIQISTYPHAQHSEDLIKSRQHINHRKSNEYLNIIIEDKQQKQPHINISNELQNQGSSIYKLSAKKNPTMQEIFKNGCPDLANVYDFVKKRRVSLKNYMNINKNKENKNLLANLPNIPKFFQQNIKQLQNNQQQQNFCVKSSKQNKSKQIIDQEIEINNFERISSPSIGKSQLNINKLTFQEPQLSQQKYLPTKSSKKSQKSSIKKSKQKQHLIDLNQNLSSGQIKQFNQQSNQKSQIEKETKIFDNHNFCFNQINENKQQKFKKSKYYVQPIPIKKQNSLDGCSISVKSSSRIIQLDFIPLDL